MWLSVCGKMDGADCSSFRRGRRHPAEESPGRGGERPLIRKIRGGFGGVERARRVRAGGPPLDAFSASGAIFARFAGSGFAAVRVRPARAAESGVGAGRESPECPDKGAGRPAPHGGAGKALGLIYIAPQTANGESMLWRYANMRELSVFEAVVRGIQGGVSGKTATRPVRAARQ